MALSKVTLLCQDLKLGVWNKTCLANDKLCLEILKLLLMT